MTEILFARLTDIPSGASLSSGTFTPGVAFGGAAVGVTYTTQAGFYTKLGSRLFFNGRVLLTSKGSSVGAATVTGLPFPSLSELRCSLNYHQRKHGTWTAASIHWE